MRVTHPRIRCGGKVSSKTKETQWKSYHLAAAWLALALATGEAQTPDSAHSLRVSLSRTVTQVRVGLLNAFLAHNMTVVSASDYSFTASPVDAPDLEVRVMYFQVPDYRADPRTDVLLSMAVAKKNSGPAGSVWASADAVDRNHKAWRRLQAFRDTSFNMAPAQPQPSR